MRKKLSRRGSVRAAVSGAVPRIGCVDHERSSTLTTATHRGVQAWTCEASCLPRRFLRHHTDDSVRAQGFSGIAVRVPRGAAARASCLPSRWSQTRSESPSLTIARNGKTCTRSPGCAPEHPRRITPAGFPAWRSIRVMPSQSPARPQGPERTNRGMHRPEAAQHRGGPPGRRVSRI
jgi:hypothetical protein